MKNMRAGAGALLSATLLVGFSPAAAQTVTHAASAPTGETVAVYRIVMVGRSVPAINYREHRTGRVDFRGTGLIAEAQGKAEVKKTGGNTSIEAEFEHLPSATTFGPEYLTYVLWAVTPEGRATNLGELLRDDSESRLEATTSLQVFGMVVTAEPYFAVSQPSDVVVLENVPASGKLESEPIVAKYELLSRGQYTRSVHPGDFPAVRYDKDVPLALIEARNAVAIARASGADTASGDTFLKAAGSLREAETLQDSHESRSKVVMSARQAVQTAEDARLIAVKRQEEMALAGEREDAAERQARADREAAEARREAGDANARAATSESLAQANALEADRARMEQQRLAAEKRSAESETAEARAREDEARRQAEAAGARAATSESLAQAHALEAERARLEQQRLADEKRSAEGEAAEARADANQARQEAADVRVQSEQEKAALRDELRRQLNVIIETRDTVRGLIVNMSDVVFATGRATLQPGAQQKLSRVAEVLRAHPGLTLSIEGHTDSTGSDATNEVLSRMRAEAVRNYLISQGVPAGSVTAVGYGESKPAATNDTAAGRQINRRVEIVIAGDAIAMATAG
jgi:outer membrane protein OmpA-like peptidoglycan-associated protein